MKLSHVKSEIVFPRLTTNKDRQKNKNIMALQPWGLKSKGSSTTELQQLTGPVNALPALSLPAVGKSAAKAEEQFLIAKFTQSHKASGTMNKQYHSHLKNFGV